MLFLFIFALVKLGYVIVFLVLAAMVACTPDDSAAMEKRHGTSLPTDAVSPELLAIDSLMWQRPDSALAVLLDYLDDDGRDVARYVSTNETFDNHYAQLLASELLFKNDYTQTNRTELLQAVAYFDSLCGRDGVHTVSTTVAFLDARAHYINGAGYYEQGDLVNACAEYLNTLRIMESHFDENELVGKKARFMALTYSTESYKSY